MVSPFNDRYDNILCLFTTEKIYHVEFKSLIFFPTHKELLSNAKFTIVNLKTGEQPEWDEGSPTFIHLIVRKRMSTNFNIFVESNDAASKLKFHERSNMELTIALPDRFIFEVDDILTIIQNALDKFEVPMEISFNHKKSKVE